MVEERTAYWRERIAEQERSGILIQQVCTERGITKQFFTFGASGSASKSRRDSHGGNGTGTAACTQNRATDRCLSADRWDRWDLLELARLVDQLGKGESCAFPRGRHKYVASPGGNREDARL